MPGADMDWAGKMQAESRVNREMEASTGGRDALAESLMLVRASTLKMIRLQLAMERRDRQVALEAVDDLIELDRRLEKHLGSAPATRVQLMQHELEVERAALNREKLGLVAEVIHGRTAPPALGAGPVVDPEREIEQPAAAPPAAAGDWVGFEFEPEEERSRRGWWIAAVLILVLALAGAAAYWFADPSWAHRLVELIQSFTSR